MTRIIGLLGAAGSGKSLVSKYLIERYDAVQYTLAAPLKQIVGRAFGLTEDQLYGSQESKEKTDPRYNVSPRWLFQHIGTEGIRSVFGPDVWWELLLKKVAQDKPALAVCDDVRFINEAAGLRDVGGAEIIRLENANNQSKVDSRHQSEAEWSKAPYDFVIQHDGKTRENLLTHVDKICYELGITPTRLVNS